ncbi:hypothetical protein CFP56_022320 [Quercus suber]|uniref:Uncharacterized protein n=1 Tax=Quercus suber TaxID=58331 RepID=A0AAW0KC56_QUESU
MILDLGSSSSLPLFVFIQNNSGFCINFDCLNFFLDIIKEDEKFSGGVGRQKEGKDIRIIRSNLKSRQIIWLR